MQFGVLTTGIKLAVIKTLSNLLFAADLNSCLQEAFQRRKRMFCVLRFRRDLSILPLGETLYKLAKRWGRMGA